MNKKAVRFLLPFAVSAEDREKAFTKEMELAAVLFLSESEREKGEGLILKKPAEELSFIAEVCYPVWLVPWRGRSLLFDGFDIMAHTFLYDNLPDVKAFLSDLKGSSEIREAYSAFLSDNLNYFQGFVGQEETVVEGLIISPEFIQDFISYFQQAEKMRKSVPYKVFLSPTINESTISPFIQDLTTLREMVKQDINNLRRSMKLLSTTAREHVKTIREEIRETRRGFNDKMASLKPSVLGKVRQIQRKHDLEITKISKKFEQQLHRLHQERVKLEKNMKSITVKIDRCEAGIKSCRVSKDETGELRWRQELDKCKKEISELKKKSILDMDKKIEDADAAKKLEISKIRSEYNIRAEDAMKPLRELEANRDAKIHMGEQEMKSVEDETSTIIDQINRLVGLKKAALNEFDKMGIAERRRKYALVHLSLYLACYQRELKKRYVVYPPSIAGSMGILTKFKGVFGVAKTKSLLQQRSKHITNLVNQLITVIESNPVFEREVNDAGMRVNILRRKELREGLEKGLEELRDEEWISESEFQTFSKLITGA